MTPLLLQLLYASSYLRHRGDAQCAQLRAGNTRVLALAVAERSYDNAWLNDHSGLLSAGWRLGVLHRKCENHTNPGCILNAYQVGSPRGLEYVYRSTSATLEPTDPQLQADLVRALVEWRPSYVQPAARASVLLMHATARAYANETAAEAQAAVQMLRCSLGAEELWTEMDSKTLTIAAAERIGVAIPWSRQVRPTRLKGEEIKEFESLLPLVIKSDRDGGGQDVHVCHDRSCLKTKLKRRAKDGRRVLQQFISGPTLGFDGSALDGQLLGGFVAAEILSHGPNGGGYLIETIESLQISRWAAQIAAHYRFTDRATGLPYLIDTNMRSSCGMGIDGTVLGMGDSPLLRLRQAVTGELPLSHFAANWYTPLAHSIVAVRGMFHDRFPPTDLMYCPSVYTAFPIQLAQYLEVMSPNTARIATDGRCSYENALHLQGLLIQPMCGRPGASMCAHPPACRPLVVSRPVPTLADVADRLCDPQYNWRRLAHCAVRARAEQAAPSGTTAAFRLGPYIDSYWATQGFELCRGIRNGGMTSSAFTSHSAQWA
ncbi:hypothetical protein T492DRAFT_1116608 [Pavlovales sp. CCMP2436]|nr:hypothetical protein T492DRAFT_1116608 [Pavlovales sp. CCMP2436]